jgi:alanine racemase
MRGSGRWSRPTPTATASSAPSSGLRGADGFALLDLAEAERVRALGWRGPVLLLEGCFEPRDLELCSRLDLWHVVHCTSADRLAGRAQDAAPHRVFLKMNSGMNRLGFTPAAFRSAWARLNALPQVDEISLMTHFADADGERGIAHRWRPSTRPRRTCRASAACPTAPPRCATAPGARVRNDWVRAGILCYGSAPDFPGPRHPPLGPAAGDDAALALIATQQLQPRRHGGLRQQLHRHRGRCASASWPAAMPTATRATAAPTRPVLVDGVRTGTVGRVSMDMLAVDLTPGAAGRHRQRGHAVGPRPAGQPAGHRRRGAGGRHHRL